MSVSVSVLAKTKALALVGAGGYFEVYLAVERARHLLLVREGAGRFCLVYRDVVSALLAARQVLAQSAGPLLGGSGKLLDWGPLVLRREVAVRLVLYWARALVLHSARLRQVHLRLVQEGLAQAGAGELDFAAGVLAG